MKGRYTGTPGSNAASEYIRDQFRDAGLKLLGEEGFQNFEVVVSVSAGPYNSLRVNDKTASADTNFSPFPFSKNATVSSGVVFAGYGFEISQDSLVWNDYEGIDVTGKWVITLRGDPELRSRKAGLCLLAMTGIKYLLPRDKGAAGVIFVSGKKFDANDELVSMYFDKTQSTAGIPVIHVKRSLADEILWTTRLTVDTLESSDIRDEAQFNSLGSKVTATTEVLQEKVMARNVVGLLEGCDPESENSYIVIGAHYDHLGMGGTGKRIQVFRQPGGPQWG